MARIFPFPSDVSDRLKAILDQPSASTSVEQALSKAILMLDAIEFKLQELLECMDADCAILVVDDLEVRDVIGDKLQRYRARLLDCIRVLRQS